MLDADGLFVPKPTHNAGYQGCGLPGLVSTVRQCPLCPVLPVVIVTHLARSPASRCRERLLIRLQAMARSKEQRRLRQRSASWTILTGFPFRQPPGTDCITGSLSFGL